MADELDQAPDDFDFEAALRGGDGTAGGEPPPDDTEPTEDAPEGEPEGEAEPEVKPADAPQSAFLEKLRSRGIDKYKDEDSAIEGFTHLYRRIGEKDEDAETGRIFREKPQEFVAHYARQLGWAPPAEKAPAKSDETEWNDEWERQFSFNVETKKWEASDDADPADLPKYLRAKRLFAEQGKKILNPKTRGDALKPYLENEVKPLREELNSLKQQIQRQQSDQAAWAFVNANSSWLFESGDQKKGPSQAGRAFYANYQDAMQRMGGADALEFAFHKTRADLMAAAQQATQPAKAKPKQVNGAKRVSSRPAREPEHDSDTPLMPDLEKMLIADFKKTGKMPI